MVLPFWVYGFPRRRETGHIKGFIDSRFRGNDESGRFSKVSWLDQDSRLVQNGSTGSGLPRWILAVAEAVAIWMSPELTGLAVQDQSQDLLRRE